MLLGLVCRGVHRMPFLPQELGGAKEQPGTQFPAHHVRPLVDEKRKIAVALDPLRVHMHDDRLGGGPHHQWLFELFPARMGYDRELRFEALDVRLLLLDEAQRDQEREVRVLVARGLEHVVQSSLHVFPDRVAPRPDHHAPLDRRVIGELRPEHQLVVPRREVLSAGGQLLIVRHGLSFQ